MNRSGGILIFAPEERWDLTVYFSIDEFACPCCGVAIVYTGLLYRLETLRRLIWAPVRVTSGYRCPKHNEEVGGAKASLHLIGAAADIVVDGVEMRKLARLAGQVGFTGILVYDDHVHIDLRSAPLVRLDPPGGGG